MAEIVLGCDSNGMNDAECQNTVKSILEKAGHNVNNLGIAPGPFASYSYSSDAKGKIGVYLMADSLVSVADLAFGGTNFKYAYFGIRGDLKLPRMSTYEDFKNNPIGRDADCTSICDKLAGKTYPQMNEITKNKCQCVFGTTPQEIGDNIVKAMGGESSSDKNKGDDSSGGNARDCVQKLLKHWDGDVECVIRGQTVYINRVREPEESYSCILEEGVNVFRDSLTITDVNPDTPNYLIVDWTGGQITFRDEKAIVRFGEKVKQLTAVRKVVTQVEVPVEDDSSSSDTGEDTDSDESTDETTTETTETDE